MTDDDERLLTATRPSASPNTGLTKSTLISFSQSYKRDREYVSVLRSLSPNMSWRHVLYPRMCLSVTFSIPK